MKGLAVRPSPSYASILNRVSCDHWVFDGVDAKSHPLLRCVLNDVTVSYSSHDGGNDRNAARRMGADMERACGCQIVGHRGRHHSRKAFRPSGYSPQLSRAERLAIDEAAQLEAEWRSIEDTFLDCLSEGSRPDDAVLLLLRRQEIAARLRDLFHLLPATRFPLEVS